MTIFNIQYLGPLTRAGHFISRRMDVLEKTVKKSISNFQTKHQDGEYEYYYDDVETYNEEPVQEYDDDYYYY